MRVNKSYFSYESEKSGGGLAGERSEERHVRASSIDERRFKVLLLKKRAVVEWKERRKGVGGRRGGGRRRPRRRRRRLRGRRAAAEAAVERKDTPSRLFGPCFDALQPGSPASLPFTEEILSRRLTGPISCRNRRQKERERESRSPGGRKDTKGCRRETKGGKGGERERERERTIVRHREGWLAPCCERLRTAEGSNERAG